MDDNKVYTIAEFAKRIGVAAVTLRRWSTNGILTPAYRTPGGARRYTEDQALKYEKECAERARNWNDK